MSVSTIVKTKRDGTLTVSGNLADQSLTVAFEAGDFQVQIPGPAVNVFLDRGQLGTTPSLRYGDDQPITGSFTAYLRDLTDGAEATLEGIITNSGKATEWESTLGDGAKVQTYKILWTIADDADHTLELDHCVITGSLGEGDPDTVSLTFTSYQSYPTVA
ncbi:MAG: hypothetical protein GY719_13315 [bacterium]|nr:hypothetical protein [bacterium]